MHNAVEHYCSKELFAGARARAFGALRLVLEKFASARQDCGERIFISAEESQAFIVERRPIVSLRQQKR